MLTEIIPTGELKMCLEKVKTARIVVDYIFVGFDESLGATELHQKAAVFALEVLGKRLDTYFASLAKELGKERKDFFQIINQSEKAQGSCTDLEHFLGRAFNSSTQKIVSLWEVSENGKGKSKSGDHNGYAEAFSDPPYGVQLTLEEINILFSKINTLAFGGLQEMLEIYEWSNDWSTYFDAGHEWWGSFLWTVRHPTQNMIVAIGASTTD